MTALDDDLFAELTELEFAASKAREAAEAGEYDRAVMWLHTANNQLRAAEPLAARAADEDHERWRRAVGLRR